MEKLVGFGTRHTLSDTSSNERGIGASRRWIKSQFEEYAKQSHGRMTVEFQRSYVQPSARVPYPAEIVNVVATLSPRDTTTASSRRIILVGGHYDSRASDVIDTVSDAPGADDDGSGTALVLELARVLSMYEFDATVVIVCFAGEEQGLLGGTQLAAFAVKKNWNIEAVLNNDIVGGTHGGDGNVESTYVRLFSEAYNPLDTGSVFQQRNFLGLENDGGSRTLARSVKEIGEKYLPNFGVRLVYRRDRFLRSGDHVPFHQRGFAAVRFTEARENFNHQHQNVRIEKGVEYGDLPKFMDFHYCANIARVNAAAIANLAWSPVSPAKVGIVTSQLEYQTRLKWIKNSEHDLSGYFVRYRETSSPVWQLTEFTTDTTLTLEVLKDDFIFGVQSVDKEGNSSLIVVPRPLR